MPVRCIFFRPGSRQPCQVLEAMGAPGLMGRTRHGLEQRYCNCGTFLCCPIFQRVEQNLVRYQKQTTGQRSTAQYTAALG